MGVAIMAGELHEVSAAIGALQAEIKILALTVRDNQEAATEEHRKVHDIVVATSEAVRNLTEKVKEMEPLTDDYRETRAERRGRASLIHILYVTFGGIAGSLVTKAAEIFSARPHP